MIINKFKHLLFVDLYFVLCVMPLTSDNPVIHYE